MHKESLMRLCLAIVLASAIAITVSCSKKEVPNDRAAVPSQQGEEGVTVVRNSGTVIGEFVTISADKDVLGSHKRIEYRIPKDTETLAIMSYPGTTLSNILGLNQLRKVRKLILNGINENANMAPKLPAGIMGFDRLELLDLAGCNLKRLDFVLGFQNLRTLIIEASEITDTHVFDFRRLSNLEGVWMNGTLIQGQTQVIKGTVEPATDPLPFEASFDSSLKLLFLSSNQFPLHFADGFFARNSTVPHIFIAKVSYDAGRNEVDLSKYPNVRLMRAQDGTDTKPFLEPGQYYEDILGDWRTYPAIK